jgi:hypothetical protein
MSNDFIPFAVGGSANVTPQATYAANTTLTQGGFQSGLAKSPDLNKVWRQSSIMAAVLAQFIVDQSGQNAVDDGTTATLEANLISAVRNAAKQTVILTDTGAANAYTATNAPALAALPSTGYVQRLNITHANTGASTYAPDGLAAKPIYGLGLQPLQGGELPVGVVVLMYLVQAGVNSGNGAWIIIESLGGAQQVAPATQSQHAVQMGQAAGVVGSVRNLSMSVTTASATATLTADEIIVETALGGVRYCLPSFSKTINLATTGAGGMDTGSAPVSGFVAIYAIWNPTTSTAALLARTEGASAATTVYSGANLPAGYTASALVGVWPTNASSQFVAGYQRGSRFYYQTSPASLTNGTALSPTAVSVSALVPKAALDYTVAITGVGVTTNSSGVCSLQTFVEAASGAGRQQAGFLGTFGSGANSISFAGPSALMPNVNQSYLYATSLAIGTSSLVSHAITDYKVPVGGE